jgi:hypothetical protein
MAGRVFRPRQPAENDTKGLPQAEKTDSMTLLPTSTETIRPGNGRSHFGTATVANVVRSSNFSPTSADVLGFSSFLWGDWRISSLFSMGVFFKTV